ncbi:hypothetical protein ACFSYD_02260 [Paracoccus aerius]
MTDKTIDHVALTVRDLPGMTGFYRDAIGLDHLGGDGETARLGAGNRPFWNCAATVPPARAILARPGCSTPPSCCPAAPIWPAGCATPPTRARA